MWAEQSAQNADGGRFARAVGAEKAEDLARPHFERHVIHGDEFAEAFDQILEL